MFYEATLLISPQVSNEEIFSLWEKIGKETQTLGATLAKEIKPLEKTLAYPIKRGASFRRAYVGIFYFEPQAKPGIFAKALESVLKTYPAILRFMVTRLGTIPETQRTSVSTKPTSEKTDRPHMYAEVAKEQDKTDKPPLAELDKKLEEILDDNIGF